MLGAHHNRAESDTTRGARSRASADANVVLTYRVRSRAHPTSLPPSRRLSMDTRLRALLSGIKLREH
jgi:hypothetical protein